VISFILFTQLVNFFTLIVMFHLVTMSLFLMHWWFFYLSNNALDAFHGISLLVKTMINNDFFARRLWKIVFKLLASKPFPTLLFCKKISYGFVDGQVCLRYPTHFWSSFQLHKIMFSISKLIVIEFINVIMNCISKLNS
jgi:hypothetical protein